MRPLLIDFVRYQYSNQLLFDYNLKLQPALIQTTKYKSDFTSDHIWMMRIVIRFDLDGPFQFVSPNHLSLEMNSVFSTCTKSVLILSDKTHVSFFLQIFEYLNLFLYAYLGWLKYSLSKTLACPIKI